MNPTTGKYMILAGLFLTVSGIVVYFLSDKLHWLGRMPGDIRIEKENFRFYFPVTTMILLSLLLNLIVILIKRLLE